MARKNPHIGLTLRELARRGRNPRGRDAAAIKAVIAGQLASETKKLIKQRMPA
jgi:hypothetical protein